MKTIGIVLIAATLLGGCAIYADPYGAGVYGPAGGVYVAPPPIVVAPPRPWWGWSGHRPTGWDGHRRGGWHRR